MENGFGGAGAGHGASWGHSALEPGRQPSPTIGGTPLPEQHEDQVQLGFRMIQNAYTSKVQHLENELRGLRLGCEEQKNQAAGLHRKNSALEVELVESHQRAQQLADENRELFKTVQNLRRQLQRLEGLKKKVLDSISDDASADYTIENEEARLAMRDDYLQGSLPLTMGAAYGEPAAARRQSPARPAFGGVPTSVAGNLQGPAARAASPPPQALGPGPGAVDGKQFFRQARSQLSYEAFNDFLSNIKRLNNQQQTREETLDEARRIFGPELQHLYKEFEQLLNRHAV